MHPEIIIKSVYYCKDGQAAEKIMKRNYRIPAKQLDIYRKYHENRAKKIHGEDAEAYLIYKQKWSRKEFRKVRRENPLMIEK